MADPVQIDFGLLKELVDDDAVSKIMVNGSQDIYVERGGKLEKVPLSFENNDQLIRLINQILSPLGCHLDEGSSMAVARLPDGSRLYAIIPPLSLVGPTLTIRKFPKKALTLDNLLAWGALNEDIADFLKACVKARLNIIVAGGVNSGKTTLVRIIASTIPAEERIVTIEERAEFRLQHEHVVTLESRPPNIEGKGAVTVRDLVIACPHMLPNRVLIGELSGPEVFEVLRLMDKGYDGTMASVFANSPQETLERIEMMVKMDAPNLPVSYLRSLIGSAVDLIVQQNRLEDGSRKVVRVTEVLPAMGDDYDLHDVFIFQREGFEKGRVVGKFESHPVSLGLMRRMEARRIVLPPSLVPAAEEGQEKGPTSE
jgi:pilus assembly protein CpaF